MIEGIAAGGEASIMTQFSVSLVDHATGSTADWRKGLLKTIQDLFDECIAPTSVHQVTVAWGAGGATDNLVLHFVEDVDHSYVQAKLPGAALKEHIGGHTRTQGKVSGSEFYRLIGMRDDRKQYRYAAYAKVALHESLHNLFPGWSESDMHGPAGGGGLAASPPQVPPTEKNKEMLVRGLSVKNEQLL
ncbi:MAG: hypothetical protein JWP04_4030 [Belnapia sp.]|nr:hypothetical protein [Belnapia sp.]